MAEPWRPWKPLPAKQLAAIIADTEQDCPAQNYTADDIYRMAQELQRFRSVPQPPPEPPPISPARAKKIALYLEYIAWRMRVG
jgi:hypothetical protein